MVQQHILILGATGELCILSYHVPYTYIPLTPCS